MTSASREAGAKHLRWLLAPLLQAAGILWLAPPAPAAELSLLHADATTVRTLGIPAAAEQAPALQVELLANGKLHRLNLSPNPGLAGWSERLAGRATAYQGDVAGLAGSWAALTRIGTRWSGMWYDGADYYAIDRAGDLAGASVAAARAPPDQPMVFRLRDVVWEDISLHGDMRAADLAAGIGPEQVESRTAGKRPLRLGVTVLADAQLARRFGAELEALLLAQVNMIDGLYATQLGIRVEADEVLIFDQQGWSPFSDTADADALLDELAEWRARRRHRESSLTHLFTGRQLDGRIVGMAFVRSVCSRRYSASLSESNVAASFSALIAAHEIGHVLGAPHDGDPEGACPTTPPDFLMAPRINGSQQLSDCSLAQIRRHTAAASCLNVWRSTTVLPINSRPQLQQDGGGGGAVTGWRLALLGMLFAARTRQRAQVRANHSAR